MLQKSLLKVYRMQSGMTQEKAAELAGVSRRTWVNYEAGTTTPRIARAAKIAKIFGVKPENIEFGKNIKDADFSYTGLQNYAKFETVDVDDLAKSIGINDEALSYALKSLAIGQRDISRKDGKISIHTARLICLQLIDALKVDTEDTPAWTGEVIYKARKEYEKLTKQDKPEERPLEARYALEKMFEAIKAKHAEKAKEEPREIEVTHDMVHFSYDGENQYGEKEYIVTVKKGKIEATYGTLRYEPDCSGYIMYSVFGDDEGLDEDAEKLEDAERNVAEEIQDYYRLDTKTGKLVPKDEEYRRKEEQDEIICR